MRRDEFNDVKIVNEKSDSFEFGHSQKLEYTFYDENKNNIIDEINDYDFSNVEYKNKKEENNKNSSNKNINNSKNNKNGYQNFITAVASIVSVSALAILIGINIINAKCNFKALDVLYDSIAYSLYLENTNNDKFILTLENKNLNYYKYYELEEGINEGDFFDLTPNTKYLISVLDTSFNNYSIYSSEITTKELKIDFNILSEVNIDTQEIKISCSNSNSLVSNIKMHIIDSNETEKIIEIENSEGVQNVVINKDSDDITIDLLDDKGFTYYFTYVINGLIYETNKKEIILTNPNVEPEPEPEPITESPIEFVLDDKVGINSSETAQICKAVFNVEDGNKLTSLILHLKSNETEEEKTYELEIDSFEQIIELNEINDALILNLESEAGFKYYLTYVYDGKEGKTEEIEILFEVSCEPAEDSFVAPTVTWNKKADLANLTADIKLSFADPKNHIYDIYFELTNSNSNTKTYNLVRTTADQKISFSTDDERFDITNGDEYHYVFYYEGRVNGEYTDREIIEEGDIIFEDYLGRKTIYNGVVCEYVLASDKKIALKMPNYVDTLGSYSNIKCYFNGTPSMNAPYVELELNDSVQEIDLSDLDVDLSSEYGFLYLEATNSKGDTVNLKYNDQETVEVNYPSLEKYGITNFEILGNYTNRPTLFKMNDKYYAVINISTRDYDNYYDNYYLRFTPDGSTESFDVLLDKNSSGYQYIELKNVNDENYDSQFIYKVQGIAIKESLEKQILEEQQVLISYCSPGENIIYGINLVNGNQISKEDGKLEMFIFLTDNTGEAIKNLKFHIGDVNAGINNPTYSFDVDIVGKDLSAEAFVLDLKSLDNYQEILDFIDDKELYLTLTYTKLTSDVTITKNAFYGKIAIID
ncbi:MAG: hypothetical protein IKP12_03010 [Acholeplasmatales bacterium]|nr:hypothetical protein [Acholeplasmatales bacterium]